VAHEHEQRLSKEDNAAAAAAAAATLKSVSETVLNASKNVVSTTTVDEASLESFTGYSGLSLTLATSVTASLLTRIIRNTPKTPNKCNLQNPSIPPYHNKLRPI